MRGLSDGVAVVTPLEGGPPGLSGALTGPIAVLYTPPVSASSADASVGLAIVTAPIPGASYTRVFFTFAAA
jgi:hypothetical protein